MPKLLTRGTFPDFMVFSPLYFKPRLLLLTNATCLPVQFVVVISVWTYCRRLHFAARLLPLLSIELSCLACRVWPSKVSRKFGSSFVLGVHHWTLASSVFAASCFRKVTHGEASSRKGFSFCLMLCMFVSLLIVFSLQGHPRRSIHQARFFFLFVVIMHVCFLTNCLRFLCFQYSNFSTDIHLYLSTS